MMIYNAVLINVIDASVAKLVDARDLKSLVRKDVPVRLRPEAPKNDIDQQFFD
jgi:hypothetical protein